MTAPRLTIAEARAMTPPDLREAVGRAIADRQEEPDCRHSFPCAPNCSCLADADAALSTIRAVFANPTPEMVRASVQGWLDSGLMSGAIREAARVVLGDDNSAAGGV